MRNLLVNCPKCKKEAGNPRKEWYYGPPKDPKRMLVKHFRCTPCGKPFTAWIRPNKITVRVINGGKGRPKTKK